MRIRSLARVGRCVAPVVACTLVSAATFASAPGSARSIEAHVAFLASDALEGRDTPSIGLDVAAEYIASRYRAAGLEPVGDGGYFQYADWTQLYREAGDLTITMSSAGEAMLIPEDSLGVVRAMEAASFKDARLKLLDFENPAFDGAPGDWAGRIVLTSIPDFGSIPREERQAFFGTWQAFGAAVAETGATMVISLNPEAGPTGGVAGNVARRGLGLPSAGLLRVTGDSAQRMLDAGDQATLSIDLAEVQRRTARVANVVGLLPGSDPELAAEHIIVSAHYDHIGTGGAGEDTIFNGANDNASGTAGVIEAAALLAAGERPRRSVLFMCYYGEEKGLVGARYYADNPLLPLEDAVANLNFEQIGRTDDATGDVAGRILPTGVGYSTALDPIMAAAEARGVDVVALEPQTRQYFRASDNIALAAKGVPAHTLCTAYSFPEYHAVGDHWNLLDYDNMALVIGVAAEGVRRLANQDGRPEWIESDATRQYIEARNDTTQAD